MRERRSDPRAPTTVTTYLARTLVDGSAAVMELRSADLSAGGIFLETEDLSALDLNEEVELRLGAPGERCHAAQARVVRSARRFEGGTAQPSGSGFGLQFAQCEPGFQDAVAALLNQVSGSGR